MATESDFQAFQTLEDLLESLGGISPRRVLLHPPPGSATEADLIAINDRKITLCELVGGVLVEKGMGLTESMLGVAIGCMLRQPVIAGNLGLISGASGPMRLGPGLVRLPDIAFASWDRIPGRRVPTDPIAGFAPDLAVEVLSPSNTKAEMARKRREYFKAGVRLVWEVDPRARTVAVYDAHNRSIVLDEPQSLDGGDVLPGFVLPLVDLFGELDRQGA